MINLLLIWAPFQQIGEMVQIYYLRKNGESEFCIKVGGPENHPSAFVLFLVLLVFRLLTSTTPTRGAEVKEGFSFLISTCLRKTRISRLVSLCMFTVHLCICVCVCMVASATSHQLSLISCQLLTEPLQVLVFPVFLQFPSVRSKVFVSSGLSSSQGNR